MKQCNKCGWVVEDDIAVCPSCNEGITADAKYVCNRCGSIYPAKSNFCPECGLMKGDKPEIVNNNVGGTNAFSANSDVIKAGAAAASTIAAASVAKAREFVNEENKEKVVAVAKATVDKANKLKNEALEKTKSVVNEENLDKAKKLGQEGLSKVEDLGRESISKVTSVVNEENVEKIKNAANEHMDKVKEVSSVTINRGKDLASSISVKEIAITAAALFIGACIGFGTSYSSKDFSTENKHDIVSMVDKLKDGVAVETLEKCIVYNNVSLRSEPSMLNGRDISAISRGTRVEYLSTVSSNDTQNNIVVAAYNLEIPQLLHRSIYVPKGTKMTFEKESGGFYYCRFTVGGKSYRKGLERQQIVFPYTGMWKKVRINGVEGYIKSGDASDPKRL